MRNDYELLAELETIWAEMLVQVLKDNAISYTAIPVYGAGLTLRAGLKERMRIYVPSQSKAKAVDILDELFSGESR